MKLDRIMGGILSILVVVLIGNYVNSNNEKISNPFELIGENGTLAVNEVTFNQKNISETDKTSEEVIEYSNNENYPVTLTSDAIDTICTGESRVDEELVEKNYVIKASFSETKHGLKSNSLVVEPGKKAYIHINTSYEGNEFPKSEVQCEYNIYVNAG